jgi:hypothetical protein
MKYAQQVCWCSENKVQHRFYDLGQVDVLNSAYIKAAKVDCPCFQGAVVAALKHQADYVWFVRGERFKARGRHNHLPIVENIRSDRRLPMSNESRRMIAR